jgi:hypothetical protein
MGAVGALVLAALKRKLSWSIVRQALESTTKLSSFVLFILIGSRVFSLTFYGVDGHVWVENLLTSLPGGQIGFLIVVNLLVFVLAFFLDFFELAFIVVPLVGPAAEHLGIDLIWFGVLLGINMQTAFMHPPFGFSLFYLRSVAARSPYKDRITGETIQPITTGQIYWGAVPFVVIQILMIGITVAFPSMVMRYKADEVHIDSSKIQIQEPSFGTGAPDFNTAPSSGGGSAAPTNEAAPAAPNFGTAPQPGIPQEPAGPNFGKTPQPDTSQQPATPNFGTAPAGSSD